VQVTPVTPDLLAAEVTELVAARPGRVRLAVDGPPPTRPRALADAVASRLRVLGRAVIVVDAGDYLRPASLRLEFGRTNPDSYYLGWLDEAGLRREVLAPAGPGGSGRVLPTLWDAARDRATRAGYVGLAPGSVVLVSGSFLLGGGLPFDVTVHLAMSPAALRRRTPAAEHWTLPAYERYAGEVAPQSFADLVVKVDDPRHPAVIEPGYGLTGYR
jgi:hypothetical protein